MQNSERLLLVFAGFFFGSVFGGLVVREFTQPPVAPTGIPVDPAMNNGPMARGSDAAGGGNQPGMEGGGNPEAVMVEVRKKLEEFKKSPDKFESQIGLGQLYLQKGDFATAASWYEKAYKQQPKNIDVLMDLAICRLRLDEIPVSEKLFREALVVQPDTPEALFALASIAWGARRDAAEANRYLDRIDKLVPGFDGSAQLRASINKTSA